MVAFTGAIASASCSGFRCVSQVGLSGNMSCGLLNQGEQVDG